MIWAFCFFSLILGQNWGWSAERAMHLKPTREACDGLNSNKALAVGTQLFDAQTSKQQKRKTNSKRLPLVGVGEGSAEQELHGITLFFENEPQPRREDVIYALERITAVLAAQQNSLQVHPSTLLSLINLVSKAINFQVRRFDESFREHLRLFEHAATPHLSEFRISTLTSILLLFAHGRYIPSPEFLQSWYGSVSGVLRVMDSYSLSTVAYAMSALQVKDPPILPDLVTDFLRLPKAYNNAKTVKEILMFTHSVLLLSPQESLRLVKLVEGVVAFKAHTNIIDRVSLFFVTSYWSRVLKINLRVRIASIPPVPDNGVKKFLTRSQSLTASALRRAYPTLDFIEEFELPETRSRADIFVPSKKLILETDGPAHFPIDSTGREMQRLKDIRRDEILESANYKIVRIRAPHKKATVEDIDLSGVSKILGPPAKSP